MANLPQLKSCREISNTWDSINQYGLAKGYRLNRGFANEVSDLWKQTGCEKMGFQQIPSRD